MSWKKFLNDMNPFRGYNQDAIDEVNRKRAAANVKRRMGYKGQFVNPRLDPRITSPSQRNVLNIPGVLRNEVRMSGTRAPYVPRPNNSPTLDSRANPNTQPSRARSIVPSPKGPLTTYMGVQMPPPAGTPLKRGGGFGRGVRVRGGPLQTAAELGAALIPTDRIAQKVVGEGVRLFRGNEAAEKFLSLDPSVATGLASDPDLVNKMYAQNNITQAEAIRQGLIEPPTKRDPNKVLPLPVNPLSDFEKDPDAFMTKVRQQLPSSESESTPAVTADLVRQNNNGIIQKGRGLSSSNLGSQMNLELPEVDANRFVQSDGPTPAPGAGLNVNMPGVSADTAAVPAKMPDEAGPSEAIEPSPKKGKASGINWMKSRQPGSVSDVRANAMYSTIGEGPMAFIRQRNSALGINAAGNIAKIDGQNYNITPEQYQSMVDGAGMTREGLDAIKNTATPFVAPGSPVSDVSSRFDTSNLNPAGAAAVEATAQPIMGVQNLVPTNPNFSTKGMTDENAEEFMKRFRAALQAGA